MTERKGDWIQTYSGRQFWPLDPRPDEIHLIDIAAALAKECRFGGHCLRFYSVAEHSVLMYRASRAIFVRSGVIPNPAEQSVMRALLLHDASEGLGLRDMPRPIKADLANYKSVEAGVMQAVAARFDFPWPLPESVKAFDEGIGLAEQRQNMAPAPAAWKHGSAGRFNARSPLDVTLQFWSPERAFAEFISAAAELGLVA